MDWYFHSSSTDLEGAVLTVSDEEHLVRRGLMLKQKIRLDSQRRRTPENIPRLLLRPDDCIDDCIPVEITYKLG